MKMKTHLENRYFDLKQHKCWFDDYKAVFPLYTVNGMMVGYQNYIPTGEKTRNNDPLEGRYFSRTLTDKVSVWGNESWNNSNVLFVTEGIFDAARFTFNGFSAIAVLSCDIPRNVRQWLSFVRKIRPVVVVSDSDKSGNKLHKYGHCFYKIKDGDPNDCSEQEFNFIINKYGKL